MNEIKDFLLDLKECYNGEAKDIDDYVLSFGEESVATWKDFCGINEESISKRKGENIKNHENITLDFQKIFKDADKDDGDIIFDHLNNIAITLFPEKKDIFSVSGSPLSQTLETPAATSNNGGVGLSFDPATLLEAVNAKNSPNANVPNTDNTIQKITKLVETLGKDIQPDASPMDTVKTILQSPALIDMIESLEQDVKSGNLDLASMMNLFGGLGGAGGGIPNFGGSKPL